MSVKLAIIDVARGSIEAGTTVQHTFSLAALALLPHIHLVSGNLGIKRDDGKLGKLREVVQLRVECSEHPIIHRTGLVDGNSDLCLTAHALTGMNLGEPLVETTRSRPLVSTLGSTHKVAQHLLPVNFGSQPLLDGLPHSRRHRAPRTSLVGFFCCLADRFLDALLGDLVGLCVATTLAETLVDIEVVVFAERRAFAVLL